MYQCNGSLFQYCLLVWSVYKFMNHQTHIFTLASLGLFGNQGKPKLQAAPSIVASQVTHQKLQSVAPTVPVPTNSTPKVVTVVAKPPGATLGGKMMGQPTESGEYNVFCFIVCCLLTDIIFDFEFIRTLQLQELRFHEVYLY